MIEVEDPRVRRGDREVLHGLSLTVPAGRVTGLLGPSGSGKTTLLRAIVGVQVIASGAVRVLGEPAGAPAVRGRVGYLTQAPATGAALLISSHVMDEAAYCDDLLLLRDGELLASGAPDELRKQTHAHDLADAFLRLIEQQRP